MPSAEQVEEAPGTDDGAARGPHAVGQVTIGRHDDDPGRRSGIGGRSDALLDLEDDRVVALARGASHREPVDVGGSPGLALEHDRRRRPPGRRGAGSLGRGVRQEPGGEADRERVGQGPEEAGGASCAVPPPAVGPRPHDVRPVDDQVQLTWTDVTGTSHTATVTLGEGPAA